MECLHGRTDWPYQYLAYGSDAALVLWALTVMSQTGERRRGVALAAFLALQVFAGHNKRRLFTSAHGAYAFVMARSSPKARKSYYHSRFDNRGISAGGGANLTDLRVAAQQPARLSYI